MARAKKEENVEAVEIKEEAVATEVEVVEPVVAAPKKTRAKKETVKKETAPRKTAAKKVNATVMVEFNGQSVSTDVIVENVKKAFEADGTAIKDLQVYVKPEDNAAYYVINQDITGKINLF